MPEPDGVTGQPGVLLLAAADRAVRPWLNGGGVTSEVAARPLGPGPAGFDWRLSIATIAGDEPFSTFAGVDRMLMAISPQGLDLVDGGVPVHLGQFAVHTFPGENEVASARVTSPTLAFNLMTGRDRCAGSLVLIRVSGDWMIRAGEQEDVTLLLLDGSLHLGERPLGTLDAVLVERGRRATVRGNARVVVARVASIAR